MFPKGPPSAKEILKIARRTTGIIEQRITSDVCLFGSAASYLWADIGRVPKDIDIVVSYPLHDEAERIAERIKEIIVAADDRYFLESSRRRNAKHKILKCRLPGWRADRRCVKVDILVPPVLKLPEINERERVIIDHVPVMPLFDLLVMKTQGWMDHRNSKRKDYREKEAVDVTDVVALLKRAKKEKVCYQDEEEADRHSSEFMEDALKLARRFVGCYGHYWKWRNIGFPL